MNIGNDISMYIIMLLVLPLLILAARLFPKLEKIRNQYKMTAIPAAISVSFVEVYLSCCVQLAYVPFSPSPY